MEYFVPKQTQIIIVNDFFVSDLQGGAELTTEALISYSPYQCYKLHSRSVTEDLVKNNKEKHWILCNYSQMDKSALIELVRSQVSYSVIEYDYKLCIYRSTHLHQIQTGAPCDCHLQEQGQFTRGLMRRAKSVHFMSQGQLDIYTSVFPTMKRWPHLFIQSSLWTTEHLDKLKDLKRESDAGNNGKWAVLGGGSWIKNQQATEKYLRSKNIAYDVIGNLPYDEFITLLAKYKGLCFHPMGFDTCPRLVIEAKLLGLKLDINSNVQHAEEDWFKDRTAEEVDQWIRTRGEHFWKIISQTSLSETSKMSLLQ